MLSLNKFSKTIEIKIVEEKYYFPGQTIKGFVNVHPKNPTKTNHIIVKFTGEVSLSVKEKDALCLFQKTKIINLAADEEQSKFYIMEPKLHTFPFEFMVPDDIQLPSTMEFNKKVRIRYTLSALHDKPMVPESLCPKAEYPVHILEFIDIDDNKFRIPQDKSSQMLLPISSSRNQCGIRVFLPRYGFTRGDIVPLSLIIHHFEPFYLIQAIDINLIRTVEIRNGKNTHVMEDILKSTKCDININDPPHFSQTMKRQLLIPTSTPPSIDFRDKLLRIQYKVSICARLIKPLSTQQQQRENKKALQRDNYCIVDIPIVVGTWPRASIPIDDDDDDDEINNITMGDTEFRDTTDSVVESHHSDHSSVISDDRKSSCLLLSQQQMDRLRGTPTTESSSGDSSSSTIRPNVKSPPPITSNDLISRSDSVTSNASSKSYSSYSSYQSGHSWGNSTVSLSRNTSLSTAVSIPESCKSNAANVISPSSETIIASPSPCFNAKDNNKYVSSLSQHHGSDPNGTTSTQQRHSFHDQDRQHQYPVLIGPSPLKYQKHQSMIFSPQSVPSTPPSTPFSTSSITLPRASSPPSPINTSPTRSFYHRRSASAMWPSSTNGIPVASPISLSPLSPLSPTVSNTILLQPVIDDNLSATNDKQTYIKTIHVPTNDELPCLHSLDLDLDLDDEDDEEDDFLVIVKRSQERKLLEKHTHLHMTEMKT